MSLEILLDQGFADEAMQKAQSALRTYLSSALEQIEEDMMKNLLTNYFLARTCIALAVSSKKDDSVSNAFSAAKQRNYALLAAGSLTLDYLMAKYSLERPNSILKLGSSQQEMLSNDNTLLQEAYNILRPYEEYVQQNRSVVKPNEAVLAYALGVSKLGQERFLGLGTVDELNSISLRRGNKTLHLNLYLKNSAAKKEYPQDFIETTHEQSQRKHLFNPASRDSSASLKEVKLYPEAIEQLEQVLMYPLLAPEQYAGPKTKLTARGAVFYGPPGTGKTMTAQAVCNDMNINFFFSPASGFVQGLQGEGKRMLEELYAQAERYAPSIVFIDEADPIVGARDKRSMELMGDVITAFLQIIDGFRPCSGVQTILATNRPYVIDNAIMSRFPAMGWIKFSLPDLSLRKEIALQKLQVIGHNGLVDVGTGKERDDLAGYIAKATEGYSGRGMHNLSMALNAHAVGWYIRNSKAIPRIREPEIDAAVRKAADYESKIKGEL